MCGIAGLYKEDLQESALAMLKRMLCAMAHRGPDDEGAYVGGQVALGHRRLSILDVSPAGHQPMIYKHLIITYNGEVYNYVEIKKELVDRGHCFRTETDTEVILHAYEEWGENCLVRFTGMWAFALLDQKRKSLFCSRDRFGIKPFYYFRDSRGFFAFASEIKALLTMGCARRVNLDRLLDYLVIGIEDHTEQTFFQGICKLQPGHSLTLDLVNGEISIAPYYPGPNQDGQPLTPKDFSDRLWRSVEIHLRSDVPVGTCLSGGIDSSVVAAMAAQLNRERGNDRFAAVTAQSESPHNDETPFARAAAEHCRLQWNVTRPTYEDFREGIETCLWFQEEPVGGPSVFMQYSVMKAAREAGLKVMLDGQGGDELMLGYERYYVAFFWYLLRRGHAVKALREFLLAAKNSKLHLGKLISFTLYFLLPPLRKQILDRRVFFLKPEYSRRALAPLRNSAAIFFNIQELQLSEIFSQQLPHLLKYEDRNSMAHSIEARVPYVEVGCVEGALRVAADLKIRGGYTKFPLRKIAEKILPEAIAWRKNKFGFEAPTDLWLRRHRQLMKNEIQGSKILRRICNALPSLEVLTHETQWRLYNIAVWERLFDVQH